MEELLNLFDELSDLLSRLSELGRQKIETVRNDDLLALNDILKQEQAYSLKARGLEQSRNELLSRFSLQDVSLSSLPPRFPRELQTRARDTIERLRNEYKMYSSASETARNLMESHIHEIEKFLSDSGVDPSAGSGYSSGDVEPPPSMKTDFRA